MSHPPIILLEEDSDFASSFSQLLELEGFEVSTQSKIEPLEQAVKSGDVPIVFIDMSNRSTTAPDAVSRVLSAEPKTVVVLLADPEHMDSANLINPFAVVVKPIQMEKLFDVTHRAVAEFATVAQPEASAPVQPTAEPNVVAPVAAAPAAPAAPAQATAPNVPAPSQEPFANTLLGRSENVINARERFVSFSQTDDDILIIGEEGLFKKDIAEEIYKLSARKNGPFIAVKSDSFTPQGFEEALLGSEADVLSAGSGQKSLLDQALNGILYIEEIERLTPMAQASLINIISSRTELRAAGLDTGALNFRLIVSANTDLRQTKPPMNENLTAHLMKNAANVPPIRERGVDAVICFDHFLGRDLALDNMSVPDHSARLMRFLMSHPWPNNVAEIRTAAAQYANELRRSQNIPERLISDAVPVNVDASEVDLTSKTARPAE